LSRATPNKALVHRNGTVHISDIERQQSSERKTREKAEAIRRARKVARKQAQRDGLIPTPKRRDDTRGAVGDTAGGVLTLAKGGKESQKEPRLL
jgi:hypothetical protein